MKEEGVKVTLRLKQGVLPHKFQCQKTNVPSTVKKMGAKRQKLAPVEGPSEPVVNKCEVLEISESQEMNDCETEPSTSHIEIYKKDKLQNNNEGSVVMTCQVLGIYERQQTNYHETGCITSQTDIDNEDKLHSDKTDSVVIKCEVVEISESEQTNNYVEVPIITSHDRDNTGNAEPLVLKCEFEENYEPGQQQIFYSEVGAVTSHTEVDSKEKIHTDNTGTVVIKCEVLETSDPEYTNNYETGPNTSHTEVDSKDKLNSENAVSRFSESVVVKCEPLEISEPEQLEYYEDGPSTSHIVSDNEEKSCKNRAVQVNIKKKYRSKGVNVNIDVKRRLNPFPLLCKSTVTSSPDCELQSCSSESSCIQDDSEKEKHFKIRMHSCMLAAIEKEPKMLIGLDKESYHLIKLLSENIPLPTINILITLKKIKLNEPFSILALQFGYPEREICRIFTNNMPLIAGHIKEFIVWLTSSQVHLKLPISFRAQYANVVSIINCLEIEIEKPSHEIHQSLTWSQYNRCNTLKYLISSTLDGLISFVSQGFSGRATDDMIVEHCGYLDYLPPNKAVIADRGFKDLQSLLEAKKCTLIRPPPVPKASTKEAAKHSRQIATLRVHVESAINKLQEFHMLLPHACIEHNIISVMNEVVIVACGLVNMHNSLIKK